MGKRLVICSPQLGISPESNLGGEVYDRELIKKLCQQGVKLILILPKNKVYLPHKNLKVYLLPFSHIYPPYLFNFLIIPYLFWLYRKEKFNILRIHSPYFTGLGAIIFKLFYPKIPVVATYHHLEENKYFYELINKLFIKRWDMVVTDSKFSQKEIIAKYKIKQNKIKVVYPGINRKFKPKAKNNFLIKKYKLENSIILMYLGRLIKRKNLFFLLQIVKNLAKKNWKLMICGDGPLLSRLRKQTKKLKIEKKVIFTGLINEKEKVNYYNLADIFLFPSQKEGFGFSLLEASACGIPVVTANNSSLRELIINAKTGYLARTNDLKDWLIKITRLLSNNKLRTAMGNKARLFSRMFSWQKTAKKQLEILNKLF